MLLYMLSDNIISIRKSSWDIFLQYPAVFIWCTIGHPCANLHPIFKKPMHPNRYDNQITLSIFIINLQSNSIFLVSFPRNEFLFLHFILSLCKFNKMVIFFNYLKLRRQQTATTRDMISFLTF